MRTDDLIARLSADVAGAPRRTSPSAAITLSAGLAAVAMVALFKVGYGIRPDSAVALTTPIVAVKTLLPALAALSLFPSVLASARPGADGRGEGGVGVRSLRRAAALVPVVAAMLFVAAWVMTPAPARMVGIVGHSIPVCLPSIVLFATPMLAGLILALRRGAPTRPTAAGTLAGLVAGSAAAALYSLYCTEDTPLFYVLWYGSGVAMVTLAGAVAGRSLLRW